MSSQQVAFLLGMGLGASIFPVSCIVAMLLVRPRKGPPS